MFSSWLAAASTLVAAAAAAPAVVAGLATAPAEPPLQQLPQPSCCPHWKSLANLMNWKRKRPGTTKKMPKAHMMSEKEKAVRSNSSPYLRERGELAGANFKHVFSGRGGGEGGGMCGSATRWP